MEIDKDIEAVTRYVARDGKEYATRNRAKRANRRDAFLSTLQQTSAIIRTVEDAAAWIEAHPEAVSKFIGEVD